MELIEFGDGLNLAVSHGEGITALTETGRLEAIWIKRFKRGPMDSVTKSCGVANQGLEGNANQGGKRQVTIIEQEVFIALQEKLGKRFDPSLRRANLMVSGMHLRESRGRVLEVGGLRIQILGETRPCEKMDEAIPGLRKALEPDWTGGVYGIVLSDSTIQVGDEVRWGTG